MQFLYNDLKRYEEKIKKMDIIFLFTFLMMRFERREKKRSLYEKVLFNELNTSMK